MLYNPGVYINKEEGRRLVLFDGLRWNNGTPSDIDGCFDVFGKGWIFIEVKGVGVELLLGQQKLYENLAMDLSNGGKFAIVIIADHDSKDMNEEVYAKDCSVRKLNINGKWRFPKKPTTVSEVFYYSVPKILSGNLSDFE